MFAVAANEVLFDRDGMTMQSVTKSRPETELGLCSLWSLKVVAEGRKGALSREHIQLKSPNRCVTRSAT
ncbi:hypothetical protein, partial [Pseudomonas syringae group genomosp. 3]|uniref:hypothetical protein n=1 Tax=Pseudomonas syringae group genomosp. 3 TaxID=251701 RepID=UPI001E5F8C29